MVEPRRIGLIAGLSWLAALLLLGGPQVAHACGGFFCSANAPVNQAAERIIFSKNADDTITAVVQIQYTGPSEEFAWVLPVPGIPEINVSSDLAFQRLQSASNPQYLTTQTVEGTCKEEFLENAAAFPDSRGPQGPFPPQGQGPTVDVLAQGTVGPYDFVVIQPDASFQEAGDVAVDWLTTEGYDVVPPGGNAASVASVLGSYLQGGMNLLAFRLTKGNDAGTIRPVWITYESDEPMIPIRPTAVAANDDMGVMVWVLGEHRAVPTNYRSLKLNEALIDWTLGGANYNAVVIAAANEAGGQGFVTERAGLSSDYEDIVLLPSELDEWDFLSMNVDTLTTPALANQAIGTFGTWDGFADVATRFLPGSVDANGLFRCSGCPNLLEGDLDKGGFLEALANEVIEPMIATQELLVSRPYVTRLYTTLSAPEMDADPLFNFNPELQDVTNLHNATQVIECDPSVTFFEAPSRFEFEDGRVVRLAAGEPWPFTPDGPEGLPANSSVLQLSTSGPGEVVLNNSEEIDTLLARHNDNVPGTGGCQISGNAGGVPLWLGLALLAVMLWTRSRRCRYPQ